MKTIHTSAFAIALLIMLLPLGIKAQSCDTLFNLVSPQDTPTYFWADTSVAGGYLSGNNEFGDEMKAEGFNCNVGYYLNSATFYFAYVTINPSDSGLPVMLYVFDNTGFDINGNIGAPGNVIDSAQVSLGQIAQEVTASNNSISLIGLMVNFPNAPALATTGVYVAVVLPQFNGDTVVLYTNTLYGPDGNGWEYEFNYMTGSGYVWGSYDEDWPISPGSLGNYISADICPAPLTSVPAARFSESGTAGCSPLTTTFTDLSSPAPGSGSWSWYFSDGASSSAQNPTHTFTIPGINIITESVSDNLGPVILAYTIATDSVNVYPSPIAVNNIIPAANVSSSTGSAVVITTGGVTPYGYSWSNNNGNTTNSISNVLPGSYRVSITSGNSCVTVDTVSINYTGSLPVGCNAAFNLAAPQNTPTYYTLNDGSYLSGNTNTSNNLAIAEGFPAAPGAYINSAVYYFAYVAINSTDSDMPVTLAVWDNDGISIDSVANAPGDMIDSANVSLREIARAVTDYYNTGRITGILANFHDVSPLTFGNIYAGVILPANYGDTLVLLTNSFNGYGGNGWEYEINNVSGEGYGWNSYDSDYTVFPPYAFGNYIVANICGTADTAILNASFTVSDTAECSPDTVHFTDRSSPAPTKWLWLFGDGSSGGGMSPAHVYAAGQYKAMDLPYDSVNTAIGPVLQFYNAATTTINSYNNPVASNAITPATSDSSANGAAVVSVANGTAPYTYSWNTGSTTDSIFNVLPAVYVLTITDYYNCKYVDSVSISFNTGILQLSAKTQVKIYPNPTANVLNLVWSQPVNADVSILDMSGNIISNYVSNGAANNIYDVRNLSSGTYVIRITDKTDNRQQSMLFTKL